MEKSIIKIQKVIKKYLKTSNKLDFKYLNNLIKFTDINHFETTNLEKKNNDISNKKRELIVTSIINQKTPNLYFQRSFRWNNLKKEIDKFIKKLLNKYSIKKIKKVNCVPKAGRGNNHDFELNINEHKLKLEWKFNAKLIKDTPQFVSPMKPSKYLSNCYEEYYYDNYLVKLKDEFNLDIPDRTDYLKTIHGSSPNCVKEIQTKYYNGCKSSSKFTNNNDDIKFYNYMIKESKKSISKFIEITELNVDKLNEYLLESQNMKHYMLYKDKKIYLEMANTDDYIITSYIKEPNNSRYVAKTKSGNTIKILLRWKNGNGVAYPAFQIS